MDRLQIAITCHQANKAYCESLGDDSQPDWADAPDWQKESALKGVDYHLANPQSTPADSHLSWLAEKEKDGWKYGPEKNPEKKEHPCFVHYEELPKYQQFKDRLFLSIVRSFEIGESLKPKPEMVVVADQKPTIGELRVRTSFNVSEGKTRCHIDEIKNKSADLINLVDGLPNPDFRLKATAMTHYETAAMYAVKAATS